MQLTSNAQTFLNNVQNTLADDVTEGMQSKQFAVDVGHCLQYFYKHVSATQCNTSLLVEGVVIEAQQCNYLHVAVYVQQRYIAHLENKLS